MNGLTSHKFDSECVDSFRELEELLVSSRQMDKQELENKLWNSADKILACTTNAVPTREIEPYFIRPIKNSDVAHDDVVQLRRCFRGRIFSKEFTDRILRLSLRNIFNEAIDPQVMLLATETFEKLSKTNYEYKPTTPNSSTIREGKAGCRFDEGQSIPYLFIKDIIGYLFSPFLLTPPQAWENADHLKQTWINENKSSLNIDDLIQMNSIVRGYYEDDRQKGIRTNQVTAAIKIHYYISPERINKELEKYLEWLNGELSNPEPNNPICTAAKSHQWLISIHPFSDGNGRTTQLVSDFILQKNGLPPADYHEIGILAAFGLNDLNPTRSYAVERFCNALKSQTE